MRILQITEASSAGVGAHVLALSRGLLDLDCEVHLLYSPRRIDAVFRSSLEQLPELRCRQIHLRRSPHISDVTGWYSVQRYVREQGPFDVIHGQSSKGGALSRLPGPGYSAVLIYTPHCIYTMNPTLGKFQRAIYRAVETTLARWTDAVIAVSPHEHRHLLDIGMNPGRVHCIPNGINWQVRVDREALRKSLGLVQEHVLIGFLGRFSVQKNPFLLLRAFAKLAHSQPHARLAMVGQGELETETRSLAQRCGIDQRVLWLGFRKAEEILPAFDIFAFPSRYEAMPYVLLEALAAGLPIVATPVGGTELTIEPDRNGLLVPSSAPEDFAAALERLITNPKQRRAMGLASLGKAREFLIPTMVKNTYDLYRQCSQAKAVEVLRHPL